MKRPTEIALWIDNDKTERKFSFSDMKTESVRAAIALQNVLESVPRSHDHMKSPYILVILPRVPGKRNVNPKSSVDAKRILSVIEWWFLHLAAIRMGVVFCPATTMLTPQDIQYRLEASQAAIVITDNENLWKIDEAVKGLKNSVPKKIVVSPSRVPSDNNDWLNYNDLIGQVSSNVITEYKDANMDSESIAQIYFTSGTTGKPKMVAHSQVSYGIGHYKTQHLFRLRPTDVNWCIADPGWAKSAYSNFFAPWITGCTVYIHQVGDEKKLFDTRKCLPNFFSLLSDGTI